MQLYNTLTRQKEEFVPQGDTVTLYVCGITTSGFCHLGHALSSITFEVLHRYLEYRGFAVNRTQNFTDIDDKVIAKAAEEERPVPEVAARYMQAFFEDMDALNVKRATVYPKATEEIPRMIELISGLIDKGHAYAAEGSVYFRVRSDDDYGKLSDRTLDEMREGTRFDPAPEKEDPADFVMWKAAKPGEPAWDSPWGPGRPGWHIECSTMALHYLGETIDIHGGGLDLIFPHHENEIAQSESYTGKAPFARVWMHNGLLRLSGDKMSKSVGNIVRVRDVLERHSADAVRLWMLSSHYRSPLLYDEDEIGSAENAVRRIRNAMQAEDHSGGSASFDPAPYRERFIAAMDDDLNTPQALAAIFDLVRELNRAASNGADVSAPKATLRELTSTLGFTLEAPAVSQGAVTDAEIETLLQKRSDLRRDRRFKEADAIRGELEEMGIAVADSADGTTWRRI